MFQSEILNAHDVCSNCFARRRREAIQLTKWGERRYFERNGDQLTTEYVPDVPAAQARSVHCRCGVDSAFTRTWDDAQVLADRDRFRELLKQLIRAIDEAPGTTIDARRVAAHALTSYDRVPHPGTYGPFQEGRPLTINDALAAGVEAGVQFSPPATEEARA